MIHITRRSMMFNIPSNKFTIDNIHRSYIFLGNIKKGQYIGPTGCNALSKNKITSVKKSFSEAIERKALMAGGYVDEEGNVPTFDLRKKEPFYISPEFATYRVQKPHVIDTTGVAVHINYQKALQKALEELLEKNVLFLFWYGKKGWKLTSNMYEQHPVYNRVVREGYEMIAFLSREFYPLYTVMTIIYKEHSIISTGISSSLHYEKALDSAFEEAYLLMWEKKYNVFIGNMNFHDNRKHLDYLSTFEQINDSFSIPEYKGEFHNYTEKLLKCVPNWVTNLHVMFLKNTTFSDLIGINLFSTDLYNHLPLKQTIDVNQTINKKTINLTEEDRQKTCDCVIR